MISRSVGFLPALMGGRKRMLAAAALALALSITPAARAQASAGDNGQPVPPRGGNPQRDVDTVIGCLNPADTPGQYTLREEGTGFDISVTPGSTDLAPYSANNEVRLRGSMVREQGRDVFRPVSVERLATTCQPTFPGAFTKRGFMEAIGRATYGIRGGVGFDPELVYMGAQAQLGPVYRNLWLRPTYMFGIGEVTKLNAITLDFAYYLPLVSRSAGREVENFWNIYVGAGPAFYIRREGFEDETHHVNFGDWKTDGGLDFFLGLAKRTGLFTELKGGAYGSPSVRLIVGYNFR